MTGVVWGVGVGVGVSVGVGVDVDVDVGVGVRVGVVRLPIISVCAATLECVLIGSTSHLSTWRAPFFFV